MPSILLTMDSVIEIESSDDEQVTIIESESSSPSEELKSIDKTKLDPDFNQLIEILFSLEPNSCMVKVIKRSLIPNYEKLDKKYAVSEKFKKCISRYTKTILDSPSQKYHYTREFCDVLKYHKEKKKVPFTTLSTEVSCKTAERCKKVPTEVVDLVTTNVNNTNTKETSNTQDIVILDDADENTEPQTNENNNLSQEISHKDKELDKNSNTDCLLSPMIYFEYEQQSNSNDEDEVIKKLEKRIELLKYEIDIYEGMEVCQDNNASPYICSNKCKAELVLLYKELCSLKGESGCTKSKQIKLNVKEGHPEMPARYLEKWLNSQTQDNGDPVFPDFIDVQHCVATANAEHKLGLSDGEIYVEARQLFVQCGTALQKRRKEREWRDLMVMVKGEDPEDPAERDPDLMRKLEDNRRMARAKEATIMAHYSDLEILNKTKGRKRKKPITVRATPKRTQTWEVPICGTVTKIEPTVVDASFSNSEELTLVGPSFCEDSNCETVSNQNNTITSTTNDWIENRDVIDPVVIENEESTTEVSSPKEVVQNENLNTTETDNDFRLQSGLYVDGFKEEVEARFELINSIKEDSIEVTCNEFICDTKVKKEVDILEKMKEIERKILEGGSFRRTVFDIDDDVVSIEISSSESESSDVE